MEKIKAFFNFDDIGTKIKNFTKWCCWIEIILVLIGTPITGIYLTIMIENALPVILSIPAAFIAALVVWISAWPMYAFGELVESSASSRNLIAKINKKENETVSQKVEEEELPEI